MSEDILDLSAMQLDALREIGNVGAGNSATALSQIINRKIEMNVPEVAIVPLNEVPDLVGGADAMKKSIEALKREYSTLRAGRATPALLDKIMVDYYNAPTPLNQVANISVPEPRMILIQPWEKTMLHEIEKAIMKSDLGLNPNSDGTAIRLSIPQLTQDRRAELVKSVNKKSEETKIAVRNIRRDANDVFKKMEKAKEVTEDEAKKAQDDMQKLVDKYIKEVDSVRAVKEKEIMEV